PHYVGYRHTAARDFLGQKRFSYLFVVYIIAFLLLLCYNINCGATRTFAKEYEPWHFPEGAVHEQARIWHDGDGP
ncbi:MAG TPA: hypothetical protein PLU21_00435, partial [Candidatus Saccharibacteria bacterium]|nr:hypothetical protein [Candidatus Saccharibacteria bacterium]